MLRLFGFWHLDIEIYRGSHLPSGAGGFNQISKILLRPILHSPGHRLSFLRFWHEYFKEKGEKKPRSINERGSPEDQERYRLFPLLDALSGLIFALA